MNKKLFKRLSRCDLFIETIRSRVHVVDHDELMTELQRIRERFNDLLFSELTLRLTIERNRSIETMTEPERDLMKNIKNNHKDALDELARVNAELGTAFGFVEGLRSGDETAQREAFVHLLASIPEKQKPNDD